MPSMGIFQFLLQAATVEFISQMLCIELRVESIDHDEFCKSDFDELGDVSLELKVRDDVLYEPFVERYERKPF